MTLTMLNTADNNYKIENTVLGTPVWMIKTTIVKFFNNYMQSENIDKWQCVMRNHRSYLAVYGHNMAFSLLFPSPGSFVLMQSSCSQLPEPPLEIKLPPTLLYTT